MRSSACAPPAPHDLFATLATCAHAACAGSDRKAFNNDVRALVESRYGRQPFDLQLETKVYVLEKVRRAASLIVSWAACL